MVLTKEDQSGEEGYMNRMYIEAEYQDKSQARLVGTIFQKNTCIDCDVGVVKTDDREGSDGTRGTVQDGNSSVSSQH